MFTNRGGAMTFKDFCIVVSFTLFLVAGVVALTTDAVLSRTAVALALFAIGFYVLSRIGSISLPTTKGPPPPG
jgi:glycerol uptake facilitator-like aquaporin